ncbi:hypothetical protein B1A_19079 [mine drainage metagenome]|uniref:Uncharacterized protein n=1 Tax=mine drainage metagenome TaxID=410659 RepID=T0YDG5_9ZZZZ
MLTIPNGLKISGVAGDHFRKLKFHRAARSFLNSLAAALKLPSSAYQLRTSQGGPAVCGETVLHGEALYVCVFEGWQGEVRVLYRACAGRRDYTGGPNHYVQMSELETVVNQARFVDACRELMQMSDELRLTA